MRKALETIRAVHGLLGEELFVVIVNFLDVGNVGCVEAVARGTLQFFQSLLECGIQSAGNRYALIRGNLFQLPIDALMIVYLSDRQIPHIRLDRLLDGYLAGFHLIHPALGHFTDKRLVDFRSTIERVQASPQLWHDLHQVFMTQACAGPKIPALRLAGEISEFDVTASGGLLRAALPTGNGHGRTVELFTSARRPLPGRRSDLISVLFGTWRLDDVPTERLSCALYIWYGVVHKVLNVRLSTPKAIVVASTTHITSSEKHKKIRAFNAQAFLDSSGVARTMVEYRRSQKFYSQGDIASTVMYIQKGGVKLSVVNELGKEAVVALLRPGDFFGEGCLAGVPFRMGMATAMTPTTVLVIEKKEMIRVLHEEHKLSDRFITYLLTRKIRVEEDLVDQLFNSIEKRLARALLLLARYGKQGQPETLLPKISQETLAEMVGTTRSRVNMFLNKFKKVGFIDYNRNYSGGIQIHNSLLSVVLHE
jgi:CRP/FNR family cyclic AMP-dependent transcriptional regulator